MEVDFKPKAQVWRGRGRPARIVPPELVDLARRTYETGQCAVVTLEDDDTEQDIRDLLNLLSSYARSVGCKILDQRDGDELRITMVAIRRRKATA